MGWSEVAARSHARRLETAGWLERLPMVRGDGSLFWATRKGVQFLGLPLTAATTPSANWWAHDSACAWTAAWLDVRGRRFLGPRELLGGPEWSGKLRWREGYEARRSGHRPDLIVHLNERAIPVEVELASKSKARLHAILNLHLDWILGDKTSALVYICGDQESYRRIERNAAEIGLVTTRGVLRLELLDTIKAETLAHFNSSRTPETRPAPVTAAHG